MTAALQLKPSSTATIDDFIDVEMRFLVLRLTAFRRNMRKTGQPQFLSHKIFRNACQNHTVCAPLTNAKTVVILNESLFRTPVLVDNFAERLALYNLDQEVSRLAIEYFQTLLEDHSGDVGRIWEVETEIIYLLEKLYDIYCISTNSHFISGADEELSKAIVGKRYEKLWQELEEAVARQKTARQFGLLIYRNILHDVGWQMKKMLQA